jgi:hypothetical protein
VNDDQKTKKTDTPVRLWLSVKEAAPIIGDDEDAIWRDIRLNQFPFEFVRSGKRIKISARSLGLIRDDSASAEAA